MAQDLQLNLAIGRYDHVRDLTEGAVRAQGIDLRTLHLPIEEIFHRFTLYREWELSEMSMGKYVSMRSQDDTSIAAIPVFVSRMFRHSMIYVREGGPIRRAEDLQGRRVGIPEWAQTAGIYARGFLSRTVGLPLASIEWVQAGINQPGRVEKVKLKLPEGVRYRQAADRSLNDLLLAGEIDAVLSARPPAGLGRGIARLFADHQPAEEAYFRETSIYPIMHTVALRGDVLSAHPWVAMNLFNAFEAAKNRSLARLREITASYAPLPWVNVYADRLTSIFGEDCFPYGLAAPDGPDAARAINWKTLDAFLDFGFEQGVCHRRLAPEELFPKQVLSSFKV